jgi:hypothetical protein
MLFVLDPRKELIGSPQVRAIGGNEAYATLLQDTLQELLRITVGVDGGAGRPALPLELGVVKIPRPKAYEVEWFCIHVWWHERELPAPTCLHITMASSSLVTVCPGSESHEWQLVTLLPAVEYPITRAPAQDCLNMEQFVLKRYQSQEAGRADEDGVCAGPCLIRAQKRTITAQGHISYKSPIWLTGFERAVMPKIQKRELAFGPNGTFIGIPPPCKSPRASDF